MSLDQLSSSRSLPWLTFDGWLLHPFPFLPPFLFVKKGTVKWASMPPFCAVAVASQEVVNVNI